MERRKSLIIDFNSEGLKLIPPFANPQEQQLFQDLKGIRIGKQSSKLICKSDKNK